MEELGILYRGLRDHDVLEAQKVGEFIRSLSVTPFSVP